MPALRLFSEHRGGKSVAQNCEGDVHVAEGEIFVYNHSGKRICEIGVQERPAGLQPAWLATAASENNGHEVCNS